MATSVIPALIDALVTNAKANLADINVLDGYGVTDDPGDFLMVGVDDPLRDDEAQSGTSQQSWANANGTARDEIGDVWCSAYSWNGNGDQKGARDAAYATVAAVENMLRANPALGVAGLIYSEFGTSQTLTQNQDEHGASARVSFQVHFRARI